MRKDKEKAFELRRSGKSYKQIKSELGIPMATLSGWFKHELWSSDIKSKLASEASLANTEKIKLMARATKEKWQKIHQRWQQNAVREFSKLKKNHLFLAGLMLYWGEGDRILKNGKVRLGNSDPEMTKLFYKFLLNLGVPTEKICASLILYPDLVDQIQKNLWSKLTRVPLSQFKNSVVIEGRHPARRKSYGICIIFVNSRELKEKIMKWIELYQDHFDSTLSDISTNNTLKREGV